MLFYGRAGIGKSAVTWQMAQAIQTGQPIWGLPTQQTNVLYIELDTPDNIVAQRFKQADPEFQFDFMMVTPSDDEPRSWDYRQFLSPMPQDDHAKIMHGLIELHRKHNYGVVFIDAMREVVPGDLSSSGLAARVYDAFRRIFPKASIVFIHHERKSGNQMFGPGDPLQSASGSMEFINVAQVALRFHRKGRDTWLEHGKSQASAEFEPLPISLREDGVHVYHRNQERIDTAAKIMAEHPDAGARELDKLIGDALHMTDRTARVIRLGLKQKEADSGKNSPSDRPDALSGTKPTA